MGIDLHDYQTTLKSRVTLSGFGVHSGKPVSISFHPADPDTGVVFHCIGRERRRPRDSRAGFGDRRHRPLHGARRSGRPSCRHGRACHGRAVRPRHRQCRRSRSTATKCRSSTAAPPRFVDAIDQAGIETLDVKRRYIRVLKPVRIENGASWAEFRPYDGTRFEVEIDFESPAIGRQSFAADINADIFRREIARARTFGFMKDVERLWAAGYALGSSLENSVVIGDDSRVINMEGLRYKDEFVRHKTARRHGRPGAGRRALHRLLPLLSRRPPAERRGAAPAAVRSARRSRSSRRTAASAAVRPK